MDVSYFRRRSLEPVKRPESRLSDCGASITSSRSAEWRAWCASTELDCPSGYWCTGTASPYWDRCSPKEAAVAGFRQRIAGALESRIEQSIIRPHVFQQSGQPAPHDPDRFASHSQIDE